MGTFKTCTYEQFDSWEDLREALLRDAEPNFVWRGVANAEWCIETSLDRFARQNHKFDRAGLIDRLKTLYEKYLVESGVEHDPVEERLWALGQHWGLPTPLLDWSKSPMAALYFAATGNDPDVAAADRDACVWRLDYDQKVFVSGDVKRIDPGSGVWNQRLRAQEGVFTQLQREGCLIDVLERTPGNIDHLWAYVYPADLNAEIVRDLRNMMIDDLRMFPDHLGVIRHVRAIAGGG